MTDKIETFAEDLQEIDGLINERDALEARIKGAKADLVKKYAPLVPEAIVGPDTPEALNPTRRKLRIIDVQLLPGNRVWFITGALLKADGTAGSTEMSWKIPFNPTHEY